MKLLAILMDSFREAIDVRVFNLLLATACALLLAFGSLTVTPRPARELLDAEDPENRVIETALGGDAGQPVLDGGPAAADSPAALALHAQGVEPLDGAPDRPTSPLLFTIFARCFTDTAAARLRADPGPVEELIRRRLGHYGAWQILEVTDVRLARPGNRFVPAGPPAGKVWFEATTRPTRATCLIWPHDSSLLFGLMPVGELWKLALHKKDPLPLGGHIAMLEEILVASLGSSGTVLVSVVVTAFFIPNMLHRGTLDLLLVKPWRRWRLLVYKYLGGLVFILLNAAFTVGGLWLVIGLRTGVWCHALLLLVPVLTFCFAVLYSVATLVAVWARSAVAALLVACLFWAILFSVDCGRNYLRAEHAAPNPGPVAPAAPGETARQLAVLDALHAVLPRTHDLGLFTSQVVVASLSPTPGGADSRDGPSWRDWAESLGVSSAFVAVMLTLACIRFSTKDY
jgi:hypothetical protein